jgi:deoxyribodipyrimidine photo-lyase
MTDVFPSTRTAALERLARFAPKAGADYARLRNYELGAGSHTHVSALSPYLRTRLITEQEVLEATLARHSPAAAQKFVQEVFWRTYWKGWLEQRPAVWAQYRADLARALDHVQTAQGLRTEWQAACLGETGIACFDHWARELVQTGYLHNHARMWFASIWVFTLRLPWVLGADFFLRHLLDGDPASNTLGWRWVAGAQTKGKTYLARADNIEKYTDGRFAPHGQLAQIAVPVDAPPDPPPHWTPPPQERDQTQRTGLILHGDDLSPGFMLPADWSPAATIFLDVTDGLSPLAAAPHVAEFNQGAMQDVGARWCDRLGDVTGPCPPDALIGWIDANDLAQIITPYAPVGPVADALRQVEIQRPDVPVIRMLRPYDEAAWPHATRGFFKFRDRIPALLNDLGLTDTKTPAL